MSKPGQVYLKKVPGNQAILVHMGGNTEEESASQGNSTFRMRHQQLYEGLVDHVPGTRIRPTGNYHRRRSTSLGWATVEEGADGATFTVIYIGTSTSRACRTKGCCCLG